MKKQKQNLSASIVQAEAILQGDKRERDETLEALENIPIKKQKIDTTTTMSVDSTSGIGTSNNFSNSFSKTQSNLAAPNFQPTYNIYQNLAQHSAKLSGIPYGYNNHPTSNSFFQGNTSYNMYNKYPYPTNTPIQPISSQQTVYSHINQTRYKIKDIPQVTVANYLQSKNVQENYLNVVKTKKEEEKDAISKLQEVIKSTNVTKNIPNFTKVEESNFSGNINNTSRFSSNNNSNTGFSTGFSSSSNLVGQYNTSSTITKTNTINNSNIQNITNTPQSNIIRQPMPQPQQLPIKSCFSESLNKYIERAYKKCKTEEDIKMCKDSLMKVIQAATKKGDLHTRDFNKFPLPVLQSETKNNEILFPKQLTFTEQELKNREKRKGRFSEQLNPATVKPQQQYKPQNLEEITKNVIIIGTCTDLEKQYLRLTTLPDPSQIRPENILKKSLQMLKEKWKNKIGDYNYINEQFRSIRQDMTIQNIKNELTVRVYETHARLALECYDIDQFNQCQTKLIDLYNEKLPGKEIEFLAYRIIYMSLQNIRYDMENLLRTLKKRNLMKNIEISHATRCYKALNEYNYYEFFKLYKISPNMGAYLIEPFLPKLRIRALHVAAVGYFTEISLSYLCEKLAFGDMNEMVKFLEEQNVKLSQDRTKILGKDNIAALRDNQLAVTKHMINIL